MSSVEKHCLGVTPPCQSQKALDVNACYVLLSVINRGKRKGKKDSRKISMDSSLLV